MESDLAELSRCIVDLGASLDGAKALQRKAARAVGLQRRAREALARLDRDSSAYGKDGRAALKLRQYTMQLGAHDSALARVLKRKKLDGATLVEDRERLLLGARHDSAQDRQRETAASLTRTRDMLSLGLEQMAHASDALDGDSDALRGVSAHHARISSTMRAAKRLVRAIQQRENREALSMAGAVAFFGLVVLYIIYKRLPFQNLLRFCVLYPFRLASSFIWPRARTSPAFDCASEAHAHLGACLVPPSGAGGEL
ncbi:hypothetical protein M885DRAFT_609841 [Pelagophyceae sp. CCMP2097]|nr:hypothetical protein M885DRAFT_609841 [Pelagophyceae sp. CCMP2097]